MPPPFRTSPLPAPAIRATLNYLVIALASQGQIRDAIPLFESGAGHRSQLRRRKTKLVTAKGIK
jgi:hypothetical protein